MLLRIRGSPASQVALFATSATEQVCTASLETQFTLIIGLVAEGNQSDESSYVVFSTLVPRKLD